MANLQIASPPFPIDGNRQRSRIGVLSIADFAAVSLNVWPMCWHGLRFIETEFFQARSFWRESDPDDSRRSIQGLNFGEMAFIVIALRGAVHGPKPCGRARNTVYARAQRRLGATSIQRLLRTPNHMSARGMADMSLGDSFVAHSKDTELEALEMSGTETLERDVGYEVRAGAGGLPSDRSYQGGGQGGGHDGGGHGGGGGGGSGGSDGSDDSSQSFSAPGDLLQFIKSRSLTWNDIPPDVREAFQKGIVSAAVIKNYVYATSNPISRFLMNRTTTGMRERFLADNLFLTKILIEEGLGICGKLSAEYEVRRGRFFDEIDFVFANVVMALLADFALVYFPAPSVRLNPTAVTKSMFGALGTRVSRITQGMPSNIFQVDRPFTMQQRVACYLFKASQLFVTGTACAAIGVSITNALISVRQMLDPQFVPQNPKSDILFTSVMYGLFLGISSSTRYQLVNGIEIHLFPRILGNAPRLVEAFATYLLRWGNTFWGSQQWALWAKFTGAQKTGKH
jgi:hypothetical protein